MTVKLNTGHFHLYFFIVFVGVLKCLSCNLMQCFLLLWNLILISENLNFYISYLSSSFDLQLVIVFSYRNIQIFWVKRFQYEKLVYFAICFNIKSLLLYYCIFWNLQYLVFILKLLATAAESYPRHKTVTMKGSPWSDLTSKCIKLFFFQNTIMRKQTYYVIYSKS